MKPLLFLFFVFILTPNVQAKDKDVEYIFFKKKRSNRTIRFKLPLKCRVYQASQDKRFGKIIACTDSAVLFEYKDYDTARVTGILAIDSLNRKERYDLVDSLIEKSKTTRVIPFEEVLKISILSGSDRLLRELGMLAAGIGFMGSGSALMVTNSNQVGTGFSKNNWVQLGGMAISAGMLAILSKRDISLEKWEFLPNDTKQH